MSMGYYLNKNIKRLCGGENKQIQSSAKITNIIDHWATTIDIGPEL